MRRTLPLWILALVSACGGSSGGGQKYPDPSTFTFDYPNGSEVSASTGEGETEVLDGAALDLVDTGRTPTVTAVDALDVVRGNFHFSSSFDDAADPVALPASPRGLRAAALAGVELSPFDDPSCVGATDSRVTFTGCKISRSMETYTLDGTLTRVAHSRYPMTIEWDVEEELSRFIVGDGSTTARAWRHTTGNLVPISSGLSGWSRGDVRHELTIGDQKYDSAFTNEVTYALEKDEAGCMSGGFVEVKHVWAKRPGEAIAAQLPDLGVQLTWTGCDVYTATVAKTVLQE